MPEQSEYLCTHNAHDPQSLTIHMNSVARNGWELVAVDFTHRGETGFHTFFWRRPLGAAAESHQAGAMTRPAG